MLKRFFMWVTTALFLMHTFAPGFMIAMADESGVDTSTSTEQTDTSSTSKEADTSTSVETEISSPDESETLSPDEETTPLPSEETSSSSGAAAGSGTSSPDEETTPLPSEETSSSSGATAGSGTSSPDEETTPLPSEETSSSSGATAGSGTLSPDEETNISSSGSDTLPSAEELDGTLARAMGTLLNASYTQSPDVDVVAGLSTITGTIHAPDLVGQTAKVQITLRGLRVCNYGHGIGVVLTGDGWSWTNSTCPSPASTTYTKDIFFATADQEISFDLRNMTAIIGDEKFGYTVAVEGTDLTGDWRTVTDITVREPQMTISSSETTPNPVLVNQPATLQFTITGDTQLYNNTMTVSIIDNSNGQIVWSNQLLSPFVFTGDFTHTATLTTSTGGDFTYHLQISTGTYTWSSSDYTIQSRFDTTPPEIISLTYSPSTKTSGDVEVSITLNEAGIISGWTTGVNHTFTKLFTENTNFTLTFADIHGNENQTGILIDRIDKTTPTCSVEYSTTELTNQDVVATLTGCSENIINQNTTSHTFTGNDTFTFTFTDEVGNTGSAEATVNNIDKVAPICSISYSDTTPTNQDVIATFTCNKDITGETGHTFTGNGNFIFSVSDLAGNTTTGEAVVTWIDKVAPVCSVEYSTTELTNQDVVATLTGCSENIINQNATSQTFTDSGVFTFTFTDEVGNTGSVEAVVTWIDKVAPVCSVEYSTTELTNQDVVATLTGCSENIINQNTTSHTFTGNDTFTFTFTDEVGNTGSAEATVNNIDKVAPICSISYSDTNPTNQDVIATFICDKDITGETGHTFTGNGNFIFSVSDLAGNTTTGEAVVSNIDKVAPNATVNYSPASIHSGDITVTVSLDKTGSVMSGWTKIPSTNDYFKIYSGSATETITFSDYVGNTTGVNIDLTIDTDKPTCSISYSPDTLTNQDVVATLTGCSEDVYINGVILSGSDTIHTFTGNGNFTFTFIDGVGNTGSTEAIVDWIDKEVPTCSVDYSITDPTNQDVVVTLTGCSEDVYINGVIASGSEAIHTFTGNGTYTFDFTDLAGNTGSVEAVVLNIDKVAPNATVNYSPASIHSGDITVTVSLDKTGSVMSGWLPAGGNSYYKIYSETTTETLTFADYVGNITGVEISLVIDNEKPLITLNGSDTISLEQNIDTYTELGAIVTDNYDTGVQTSLSISGNIDTSTVGTYYITYTATDLLGNIADEVIRTVHVVDTTAPEAFNVIYHPNDLTSGAVTVVLETNEVVYTPAGWSGNATGTVFTKTYTNNVSETVYFSDIYNNTGSTGISITWIDADNPGISGRNYTPATPTSGSVTATFTTTEAIQIPAGRTKISDTEFSQTFTENTGFDFEIMDLAGNTGSARLDINWIDATVPTILTLTQDPSTPTNSDVILTLTTDKVVYRPSGREGAETGTTFTKTFTDNASGTVSVFDLVGNESSSTGYEITNIDKTPIQATVTYSTTGATDSDVVATISFNKSGVSITNNGSSNTYTFTDNDSFTFTFSDSAGNTGEETATVNRINKTPVEIQLSTPSVAFKNQTGTITGLLSGSNPAYIGREVYLQVKLLSGNITYVNLIDQNGQTRNFNNNTQKIASGNIFTLADQMPATFSFILSGGTHFEYQITLHRADTKAVIGTSDVQVIDVPTFPTLTVPNASKSAFIDTITAFNVTTTKGEDYFSGRNMHLELNLSGTNENLTFTGSSFVFQSGNIETLDIKVSEIGAYDYVLTLVDDQIGNIVTTSGILTGKAFTKPSIVGFNKVGNRYIGETTGGTITIKGNDSQLSGRTMQVITEIVAGDASKLTRNGQSFTNNLLTGASFSFYSGLVLPVDVSASEAGAYKYFLHLYDVNTQTILKTSTDGITGNTLTVKALPSPIITLTNEPTFIQNITGAISAKITGAATLSGRNMQLRFTITSGDATKFQLYDHSSTRLTFKNGVATGDEFLYIPAINQNFTAKFTTEGAYAYTVDLIDVATNTVVSSSTAKTISVGAKPTFAVSVNPTKLTINQTGNLTLTTSGSDYLSGAKLRYVIEITNGDASKIKLNNQSFINNIWTGDIFTFTTSSSQVLDIIASEIGTYKYIVRLLDTTSNEQLRATAERTLTVADLPKPDLRAGVSRLTLGVSADFTGAYILPKATTSALSGTPMTLSLVGLDGDAEISRNGQTLASGETVQISGFTFADEQINFILSDAQASKIGSLTYKLILSGADTSREYTPVNAKIIVSALPNITQTIQVPAKKVAANDIFTITGTLKTIKPEVLSGRTMIQSIHLLQGSGENITLTGFAGESITFTSGIATGNQFIFSGSEMSGAFTASISQTGTYRFKVYLTDVDTNQSRISAEKVISIGLPTRTEQVEGGQVVDNGSGDILEFSGNNLPSIFNKKQPVTLPKTPGVSTGLTATITLDPNTKMRTDNTGWDGIFQNPTVIKTASGYAVDMGAYTPTTPETHLYFDPAVKLTYVGDSGNYTSSIDSDTPVCDGISADTIPTGYYECVATSGDDLVFYISQFSIRGENKPGQVSEFYDIIGMNATGETSTPISLTGRIVVNTGQVSASGIQISIAKTGNNQSNATFSTIPTIYPTSENVDFSFTGEFNASGIYNYYIKVQDLGNPTNANAESEDYTITITDPLPPSPAPSATITGQANTGINNTYSIYPGVATGFKFNLKANETLSGQTVVIKGSGANITFEPLTLQTNGKAQNNLYITGTATKTGIQKRQLEVRDTTETILYGTSSVRNAFVSDTSLPPTTTASCSSDYDGKVLPLLTGDENLCDPLSITADNFTEGQYGWTWTCQAPAQQTPPVQCSAAKTNSDANIDTDGDEKPDLNIDSDLTGKPDLALRINTGLNFTLGETGIIQGWRQSKLLLSGQQAIISLIITGNDENYSISPKSQKRTPNLNKNTNEVELQAFTGVFNSTGTYTYYLEASLSGDTSGNIRRSNTGTITVSDPNTPPITGTDQGSGSITETGQVEIDNGSGGTITTGGAISSGSDLPPAFKTNFLRTGEVKGTIVEVDFSGVNKIRADTTSRTGYFAMPTIKIGNGVYIEMGSLNPNIHLYLDSPITITYKGRASQINYANAPACIGTNFDKIPSGEYECVMASGLDLVFFVKKFSEAGRVGTGLEKLIAITTGTVKTGQSIILTGTIKTNAVLSGEEIKIRLVSTGSTSILTGGLDNVVITGSSLDQTFTFTGTFIQTGTYTYYFEASDPTNSGSLYGTSDLATITITETGSTNTCTNGYTNYPTCGPTGGGGGGGGGGYYGGGSSSSSDSNTPTTDITTLNPINPTLPDTSSALANGYTQPQIDAYLFAYLYGLTSISGIDQAQLFSPITRAEFSKMISNFAINVLGKVPDTTKDCSAFLSSISSYKDSDLHKSMITSCQLNLMGINSDSSVLTDFMPDSTITRAETATVISRLLRDSKYNVSSPDLAYYTLHISALAQHNIITDTTPTLTELRARIFIELYRAFHTYTASTSTIKEIKPDSSSTVLPLTGYESHLTFTDAEKAVPNEQVVALTVSIQGILNTILTTPKYANNQDTSTLLKNIFISSILNTTKPIISATAKLVLQNWVW